MKKILLITTGGTIASAPGDNGLTPQLTGAELLAKLPKLNNLANISTLDLLNLDSTNLAPEHWLKICQTLVDNYQNYQGFIISHGTDTLTWTCAALKLMLENLGKPVVLVASQLTMEEIGSDAPHNLAAALHMALSGIPSVFAVCNGQIFPALWFSKIASENLDCFTSTNEPPLAIFNYEKNDLWAKDFLQWLNKPDILQEEIPTAPLSYKSNLDCNLANIFITPLTTPKEIELYKDYHGLIIHGYGAGGIPSADSNNILDSIITFAQTKPVICITQCLMDGVHLHRYEVGRKALQSNIIPGGKLGVEGATILLMLTLGANLNLSTIKNIFHQYTKKTM